jgi:hypothetical protein
MFAVVIHESVMFTILMRLLELVHDYSDLYAASVVSCDRLRLRVIMLHLNNDTKADGGQVGHDRQVGHDLLFKVRSATLLITQFYLVILVLFI